jgi:tetratricopeptide (TPR) repeat protein
MLGDAAAKAKRWDDAAEYYAQARHTGPASAAAIYLHGRALAESGDPDGGTKLMEQAKRLPLADDRSRAALAGALQERGLTDEATAQWEMVLRLHDFWAGSLGDAARHAALAAADKGEFARAADLLGRSTLMIYRTEASFTQPRAYLLIPRTADTWRAMAMLDGTPDAKTKADALRLARQSLATLPGDSDWTIRWVEHLDKLGLKAEADALFAESFRTLADVCARYPSSGQQHNALAWMCARCGRELDAAVEHADKAVSLQPDSAACIDTLAEAHFRRGDRARAAELMRKCLELEPDSEYFRGQLKRFESADSSDTSGGKAAE